MQKVMLKLKLEDKIEYIAIKKKTDTSEIILREYNTGGTPYYMNYEVMVVDPSHKCASPVRVQLASGVKALRKLPWTYIGAGVSGTPHSLTSYEGKLYASTDNGVYCLNEDEGNWVKISEIAICDMQVYGNYLYGFLNFFSSGDKSKVYCYNGSTWTEVGFFDSSIRRLVVAGGNLYALWGYVWRYQGGDSWEPCNWYWFRDLFEHNGQLYAIYGGDYTYLYLYNGEDWTLASYLGRNAYSNNTAVSYEANLYIGGMGVQRWNGLFRPDDEWTKVGEGGPSRVQSLIEYNGKLHAIDYYGVWCYGCYEGEESWVMEPLAYGYYWGGTHTRRVIAIHNGKLYAGGVWRYDINQ